MVTTTWTDQTSGYSTTVNEAEATAVAAAATATAAAAAASASATASAAAVDAVTPQVSLSSTAVDLLSDHAEGRVSPDDFAPVAANVFLNNPKGYLARPKWSGAEETRQALQIEREFRTVASFMAASIGTDGAKAVRAGRGLFYQDAAGTIIQDDGTKWVLVSPAPMENRAQAMAFITAIDGVNGSTFAVGDQIGYGGRLIEYDGVETTLSDAAGWKPIGTISINHYQTTDTPSTTDRSAALLAAITYAASIATDQPVEVSGDEEDIALASMVTLDTLPGGVLLNRMRLVAIGSWSGTFGTLPTKLGGAACPEPMLKILDSDKFCLGTVMLECSFLSSGIYLNDCKNFRAGSEAFIHGMGDDGYGLRTENKAGNLIADGMRVQQFNYNEAGFDTQANRTAVGFLIETADFMLDNCSANYCLCPVYKGDGANGQIVDLHVFNGALTGTVDPATNYVLVIDDPRGLQITNLYSDKGLIWINADGLDSSLGSATKPLQIENVHHVTGTDDPTLTRIVFETTLTNNDLAGVTLENNRFPVEADNITFTGSGTFSSNLKWHYFGNYQNDGTPPTGASSIFNVGGYFRLTSPGTFIFGRSSAATFAADKEITIAADYNANSSGSEKYINFSNGGTVFNRIVDTGFLQVGVGQATGGGSIGQIGWGTSNQLRISGPNAAGTSLDFATRLEFAPTVGWTFNDVLTAAGQMNVAGDLVAQANLVQRATATVSIAAAATLTVGNMKTAAIVYTGAAANLTTPTGAGLVAGFPSVTSALGFEFYVVNTGSGTATLVAGDADVTFIGSAAVAAGVSATFFARKTTSGNAWQIIRRA